MKKFITIAAVAAFGLAGTLNVQAATTQSQIDALLAQIAALQSGATVSTGATFVYQGGLIRVGSRGQQVRDLQTCLAAKGINASSNIDGVFGSKTAAAVRTFQAQNGVAVDGIIGPVTGPLYTQACAGSTVVVVEDDSEDEDSSDVSSFDTHDGEEADFTDFDVEDADDDTIQEGEDKVEIAEIEFELEEGGAALLERFDAVLDFTGTDDGDEDDAWDVFNTIYLMVDGDVIAEMDADDEKDWEDALGGDDNRLRITGINHVFDAEEDHTIVVAADLAGSIDLGGNDTSEWTLSVSETGLRFVDEAGITVYLSEEDTNTVETATFDIEEEGQEDELTVRDSDDDPEATALEVEDDENSDWYNIFTFEVDVDEDSQDLEFNDIVLTVSTGTANVEDVIDDLELRVGGESFDDFDFVGTTGASTTATVTFDVEDEDLVIDTDEKMDIELWAEFKSANLTALNPTGNYAQGETVIAEVTSADVDLWDVDGGDELDASQLQGAADGEEHTLLVDGAIVTLDTVSENVASSGDGANNDANDTAEFTFEINVEAFDETVYIPVVALDAFSGTTAAAAATGAALVNASTNGDVALAGTFSLSSTATEVTGGDGEEYYKISSNEDFTIRIVEQPTAGDYYAELRGIFFTSEDVLAYTAAGDFDADSVEIVLDEDEFQTGTVTLLN